MLYHCEENEEKMSFIFLVMAFSGKVVLITGASSGIGAATAVHLCRLGASLSLTGRNADNLNKVAAQIGRAHV
jgi:NADP-dependent 3-hydroxy acid dehydrogenase YdfG